MEADQQSDDRERPTNGGNRQPVATHPALPESPFSPARHKTMPDHIHTRLLQNHMDPESVRGVLDELFVLARQYRRSEKFKELIEFVGRFKRYSAFNAMLVHIQMPGARYVLPAKRWMKEHDRIPTKDAQPLVMLQPKGPIMFGFDVSQTEGEALPQSIECPRETVGLLKAEDYDRLLSNARRDGVDVSFRSLGSTYGGYIRNAADPNHVLGVGPVKNTSRTLLVDGKNVPVVAEITLNSNRPRESNFATLTHELGHLYCGHVGTPNPKWWPDRRNLDRNAREFEAESVSYLVCRRADLETPAVEYLHGYLNANEEIPAISLHTVFSAAKHVEAMRNDKMKVRSTGPKEI